MWTFIKRYFYVTWQYKSEYNLRKHKVVVKAHSPEAAIRKVEREHIYPISIIEIEEDVV